MGGAYLCGRHASPGLAAVRTPDDARHAHRRCELNATSGDADNRAAAGSRLKCARPNPWVIPRSVRPALAWRVQTKSSFCQTFRGPTVFLTEREVADRLRCSLPKVKRLRLTGKLTYLPGRPPLVDEEDLESYIAFAKRSSQPPPPTPEEASAKGIADARQRARMTWLQKQMRREGRRGSETATRRQR